MENNYILQLKSAIDKSSSIPLYAQIENKMRELIDNSILSPGQKICGDKEMAEALEVSHITIRKALVELEKSSLIRRVKKSGTFINDQAPAIRPCVGYFYNVRAEDSRGRMVEFLHDSKSIRCIKK